MEKSIEEKIKQEIIFSKKKWNYKSITSYLFTDYDIRQIFATSHEVNLERDDSGMPIPGTGRLISNEEKKQVFDYILENNYPLTKKMYNIILYGYLNNEIELNINKGPKL